MADRATPLPVRVRVEDATLHCEVQRVIGYRATCGCGWRGPHRADYGLARSDANLHNRGQHGRA
jgi:hypothetical protein